MPAADFVDIQVDLEDVSDFETNRDVGKIWEASINGVGYMLANDPTQPRYERGAVPLIPERLATSDTPFSENVNRYTFYAQSQYEGGEGQEFGNRSDTDPRRYWQGAKVDPFDPGLMTVGPSVSQFYNVASASPVMTVVGDTLFLQSASNGLVYNSGSGWSTLSGITDPGAITILDMASDGYRWYAATGTSIVRGLTTNPAASWSTVDAVSVDWSNGRVVAAVKGAGSSTPNIFTTLNASGVEESMGGLFILPVGHTIDLGAATQGFYYFAGYAGTTGSIYAWQLGLNEAGQFYTPHEAWALPAGSKLIDVSAGGGSVWIQVIEKATQDRVLYRGIPNQSGQLQILRVAEFEGGGGGISVGLEWDHKMMFMWPASTIAAVGLEYGGLARWSDTIGTGTLVDMAIWQGEVYVTDSGGVLWRLTGQATSGWFTTPIWDGGSNLDKVFDDVTVACEPLSSGESIMVEYSVDHGVSFTTLGTVSTPGATRYVLPLGVAAQSIQLRVTLYGTGLSAPVLSQIAVRLHPLGLVDGVLVLPILCGDNVEGLNGQIVPGSGRGVGAAKARELEQLAGRRVKVQDVDWPYTQVSEIYEVLQAQTQSVWLQSKEEPQLQSIVTLTMRSTVTR